VKLSDGFGGAFTGSVAPPSSLPSPHEIDTSGTSAKQPPRALIFPPARFSSPISFAITLHLFYLVAGDGVNVRVPPFRVNDITTSLGTGIHDTLPESCKHVLVEAGVWSRAWLDPEAEEVRPEIRRKHHWRRLGETYTAFWFGALSRTIRLSPKIRGLCLKLVFEELLWPYKWEMCVGTKKKRKLGNAGHVTS